MCKTLTKIGIKKYDLGYSDVLDAELEILELFVTTENVCFLLLVTVLDMYIYADGNIERRIKHSL